MRMRSALAGFALLASASVALAAGPSKEMRGEITKVTPSAHELVVKSGAAPHEDVTFEVPATASIAAGGKPELLSDLKTGDTVVVRYSHTGAKRTAEQVTVMPAPAKKGT